MHVDFGDEPDSEHNIHLTRAAHYEHAGSSAAPSSYSPLAIDPGLEQSTGSRSHSLAHAHSHRNGPALPMSSLPPHHTTPPSHLLQPDNAAQHFAHGFYADMAPRAASSQTPPASSNTASPRFSAISPTSQPKQLAASPSYVPEDRSAPSRHVTDDTIDDAYAAFILYCNPNFSTSIDTSELVKLFRIPPKSDGNAFSTWRLFELIGKFDSKEIKTWTQLALDLGVKPPNTDEGQSTQKVQQYSVRLKVRLFYSQACRTSMSNLKYFTSYIPHSFLINLLQFTRI